MATRLKDTDVVIIGLGAAGGVAALPLAQAGLEVVGLEAGTWLTRRDFAPDELRNNVRDWPQAVQKANQESPDVSRQRVVADHAARRDPSDDERRRRHDAALLGAELAAEPVGLQGRERDDAALRRLAHSDGLDGRGLAVRSRRARAVLRQGRVRDRRLGPGGQHQRQDRSARQHLRGSAPARLSDAAAARHRVPREDGGGGARRSGGIRSPVPPPINSRPYQNRSACMYHGFCNRGGCHVDAKNSTAVTTIPRAQATGQLKVVTRAHVTHDRGRRAGPRDRRHLRHRRRRVLPAGESRAARQLHLREHPAAAAVEVEGVSERPVEQPRAGRPSLLQPQSGRRASPRSFRSTSNSWYGLPAQGVAVDNWADDNFDHSGLDFIGGGNLWVYSDRRPIGGRRHEHVRPRARAGARRGRRSSRRTPIGRTAPTSRRRRCRTRTTSSISIRW